MKIDGGYHCGYITYEAEADPEKVGICHCTDCQTLSGSAFRTGIRVASDCFYWQLVLRFRQVRIAGPEAIGSTLLGAQQGRMRP